ncbi:hypothetical protein BSNK01_15690 [Bacillaceae bacterium]
MTREPLKNDQGAFNMAIYLVPLLFSFFLVYLLIPPVRSWALRKGLVDRPSRRKIHQAPIPLAGGLALYLGIAVTWLLFLGWTPDVIFAAAGGLCLVAIGFVDDWHKARGREFSPWPRLFVQGIVATLVYAWGVRFVGMGVPLGDGFLPFPAWLSYLATLLSITITLLALGVPVFDTLQVIFSRLKRGTPIYRPDRLHVHHRLLAYGLTQRQAVIVIYAISLGFSFLSILILFLLM